MDAPRPLRELKTYRQEHEPPLSRSALAKSLGVSRQTVHRWEEGKRRPDKRYVPTLSEMTGVPILELMGIAECP